jgi:hypothetical protein
LEIRPRRITWGACNTYGRDKKYTESLEGKPEWKRPLGRSTHRWEDNIGTDLRGIGWEGVDLIHLAQDTVIDLRIS